MSLGFKLVGTDEALNGSGIQVYLPKDSWSIAVYEAPWGRLKIPFSHQFICQGVILTYLFSLPSDLCWDGTTKVVAEKDKDQISEALIEAFSLFGALGVRHEPTIAKLSANTDIQGESYNER